MGVPVRSWRTGGATWIRLGALVAMGGLLVVLPLMMLVLDPLDPIGPASPVSAGAAVTDPHFRGLLWTSLRLACWVTTVTLVVGVPYGLWLAWTRSRAATPLVVMHLLPLCLPPYVTALAWSSVLGRQGLAARLGGESVGGWTSGWFYGETGVVLVLAVALAPIVTPLYLELPPSWVGWDRGAIVIRFGLATVSGLEGAHRRAWWWVSSPIPPPRVTRGRACHLRARR